MNVCVQDKETWGYIKRSVTLGLSDSQKGSTFLELITLKRVLCKHVCLLFRMLCDAMITELPVR
jgi:hypothetical protein